MRHSSQWTKSDLIVITYTNWLFVIKTTHYDMVGDQSKEGDWMWSLFLSRKLVKKHFPIRQKVCHLKSGFLKCAWQSQTQYFWQETLNGVFHKLYVIFFSHSKVFVTIIDHRKSNLSKIVFKRGKKLTFVT